MSQAFGRVTLAVVLVAMATSAAVAQFGGFRGPPGGPGGDGILALLQREDVRREIQLVGQQQQQLEALADELRREVQESFGRMRDLSPDERRVQFEEIRARTDEIRRDAESRVQNILLPHQYQRLKQIELQMRMQQRGAVALTTGELADTLGLTTEQQERLRQRAQEVQQELEEQIRQLRAEARSKLLEVLTAEQRAKLESLLGEQFDVADQTQRFGRPGRDGGRFRGFRGDDGRAQE